MEKPTKTSVHRYEDLAVTVTTAPHNYGELYKMALRINKKRAFLFVSTVLGKHLPLRPQLPLIASALLAVTYYEQTTGKQVAERAVLTQALQTKDEATIMRAYEVAQQLTLNVGDALVIGFAETATALGHGVYDCLANTHYIHSTREVVDQPVTLYFEEEHSHATDQRCYADEALFMRGDTIILVDDEITTGKTAMNIIASLQERFAHKKYVVLSLLDWRTAEHEARTKDFAKQLGIELQFYSLVRGTVTTSGAIALQEQPSLTGEVAQFTRVTVPKAPKYQGYLRDTGRFGTNASLAAYCQQVAQVLAPLRTGRTAVIGTGEFMYVPMKVASYMGEDVWYHATTRSPIYVYDAPHYPITARYQFQAPEEAAITHYIYNVAQYDEVIIMLERDATDEQLAELVRPFHASTVYIVTM